MLTLQTLGITGKLHWKLALENAICRDGIQNGISREAEIHHI